MAGFRESRISIVDFDFFPTKSSWSKRERKTNDRRSFLNYLCTKDEAAKQVLRLTVLLSVYGKSNPKRSLKGKHK